MFRRLCKQKNPASKVEQSRKAEVPPGSNRASSGGGGRARERRRVRYVPPKQH